MDKLRVICKKNKSGRTGPCAALYYPQSRVFWKIKFIGKEKMFRAMLNRAISKRHISRSFVQSKGNSLRCRTVLD
ncbi:MAG: hypothetical protein A2521_10945 [Deltaproteobacteria bacterium RIFOXYD12_FULL_57_12]|nr:MAG: hypothetical protein A2521_10945 [Deltaproteobacteria bacterium RIFOXYD12_FULL_57_12]